MKTIVFSDVHGNLPALEAMLRHAGPADRYVSLGDVVNYGPWSDECVQLLEALPNCDKIVGNHDEAFLKGSYDGTHPVAQAFFRHCHPRFTQSASLTRYSPSVDVGAFQAQHTLGGQYIYPTTPLSLDGNYLIGHSHHQFKREDGGWVLYNAGSVGQNRGLINVINYLVCGPRPDEVRMAGFTYDVEPVIAEMRRRDYPPECLAYYEGKPRA